LVNDPHTIWSLFLPSQEDIVILVFTHSLPPLLTRVAVVITIPKYVLIVIPPHMQNFHSTHNV